MDSRDAHEHPAHELLKLLRDNPGLLAELACLTEAQEPPAATRSPGFNGRSRRGVIVGALALVALCLVGTAAAQSSQLVTFVAGAPARASDVNANFQLLKQWVEDKVGDPDTPGIQVTGNASVTGQTTSTTLSVTSNAIVAGTLGVTGQSTLGNVDASQVSADGVTAAGLTVGSTSNSPTTPRLVLLGGALDIGAHVVQCNFGADNNVDYRDCFCPTGENAISGGALADAGQNHYVRESRPVRIGAASGWRVSCGDRDDTHDSTFECEAGWAVCARIRLN